MAEVKTRKLSRDEAQILAMQMENEGLSNAFIREVLMDKGLSVRESNEIIGQVRHLRLKMRHLQVKDSQGFFEDRLALILLLLALLVIIFYALANKAL